MTLCIPGYSFIQDPYYCLVYEVMESITTALMVTSMMAYAAQLGTTTTLATIQGLIFTAYYGIGRGTGNLVGGFLIQWFGDRNPADKTYGMRATFRVIGVAAAVTGFLYFFFTFFYSRHLSGKFKKEETIESAKDPGIQNLSVVSSVNEQITNGNSNDSLATLKRI